MYVAEPRIEPSPSVLPIARCTNILMLDFSKMESLAVLFCENNRSARTWNKI